MKKAKIFLTALTVVAVAGGALAFKAKQVKSFYKCNTQSHFCEIFSTTAISVTTTASGGAIAQYNEFGAPCTIVQGLETCTTRTTRELE